MKKCSLTIAICTYNRANIISECLASLNKQTVDSTNYTLLVIDNNSTDNTKEIVSSFKDKFSKLVIRVCPACILLYQFSPKDTG